MALWPNFAPQLITVQEAEAFFNVPPYVRIRVNRYLTQAEHATTESVRAACLAEAREWLAIECDNIEELRLAGHPAPDNVMAEVEGLVRAYLPYLELLARFIS